MTLKTIPLAALAALAISSMPVAAQETRLIHFTDLDLTHPDGVERLDRRISSAIRSICRTGDPSLRAKLIERRCGSEARAAAQIQRELAIAGASQRMADMLARDRIAGR